MPGMVVINDRNFHQHIEPPAIFGEKRAKGLRPRDFQRYGVGSSAFAPKFDIELFPEKEWEPRLKEQEAANNHLHTQILTGNFGNKIPSRDQNGRGYCWQHSGVSAMLAARARDGDPYVDLSAYGPACVIKGFRDEGGWGLEGVEFLATRGCPTSKTWPQRGVSRSYDNPATWAEAARYKIAEWMDGDESGPNVKAQLVTSLLLNLPCVVDFNWWSHSVCAVKLVSLSPFRILIWNSWGDEWSEGGFGILEGTRAMPNGLVVPRVATPSMAA